MSATRWTNVMTTYHGPNVQVPLRYYCRRRDGSRGARMYTFDSHMHKNSFRFFFVTEQERNADTTQGPHTTDTLVLFMSKEHV